MIIFRCKNTKFLKKTTIFHLFFLILPERPTGVTLIRPTQSAKFSISRFAARRFTQMKQITQIFS